MVRVTIPADFSWTPGQHVFIRFLTLGLHSLTAHPFTICSLPASSGEKGPSQLVFYIRPRGGFTSRLAKLAGKQPNISLRVLLDGPYGGVNAKTMTKFDKALVIAGGSGAGFTLSLIEDVVQRLSQQHGTVSDEKEAVLRPRKTVLQVVLATRDRDTQRWYHEAIADLLSPYSSSSISESLHISVYFTGSSSEPSDSNSSRPAEVSKPMTMNESSGQGVSNCSSSDSPSNTTPNFQSRPDLPRIVQETTSANGVSVGIAVCGPASMLQDVRNAAATAQTNILRSGAGAKDVYLHTEQFSYVPNQTPQYPCPVNVQIAAGGLIDRRYNRMVY